ncbi:hypothetical protein PV518_37145 [Streptomyces sp. ND04-05B]|uniref:hypothetical protein n=1 Tax=Streptomyces sp. ND04-05B TaxID=3028693 RepID=UPI0029A2E0D1|nr:hypothetical protein [Streptomyces sp. ND04-05B]MDX3067724.1 hypothetical protein [Streptomyces sp. ND04-05B]
MSAPSSSAPLVVNTRDGACWTRRTVTSSGIALYALADVCGCPEFVMATLPELAELGIAGSADVLPVPVGPESRSELERMRLRVDEVERAYTFDTAELKRRVAELEAERHSTNESLSDAAEQLRTDRDRIAELEKREAVVAKFVAARAEYITSIRNCHPDNAHDYDRWQGHAAARRQLAELLGLPVAWPTEHGAGGDE